MPRFFVCKDQIEDGIVTIKGDDAHHISRSLRMAAGESITVCDMQKYEYECELYEFLPDCVRARVISMIHAQTEPPYDIHLFQALPKGDKLDSIIQKSVECGVTEITTFESERCIVRIKDGGEAKKLERRQRIALEAAKQSGRGCVPTIHPSVTFRSALQSAAQSELVLFCYEGDGTESLSLQVDLWKKENPDRKPKSISIVIGSEGGFSTKEAAMAEDAGLRLTGLGKRILRTETASSFVLACLAFAFEMD